MKKFSFSIRLKVLLTVVVMLMLVVGVITSTMANLFHQDKTTYVRAYSSGITEDITTGIQTILGGYVSATRVLAEVLFADYVDPASKHRLIKPLFAAYPEMLALISTNIEGRPVTLYNASALKKEGMESDAILKFAPRGLQQATNTIGMQSENVDSGQQVITLTLGYQVSGNEEARTVVAIIAPTLFKQVLQRAGAFDAVLLDADKNALVTLGRGSADVQWARQALLHFNELGRRSVVEYEDEYGKYIAGASTIGAADVTVVTRISASAAYLTARNLLGNLVKVGLAIIFLASLGGVLVSRRLTRPLEQLSQAVRKVAKGNFDVKVDINSKDEIGQLSNSFNEMAGELNVREQSLKKAQLALIQSEKMAAVGTLSAGLAHEVKNPLSSVLGYAQLAKRKINETEVVKAHLDIIESETRRCNDIIGNLMQFSRAEKGEFDEISINTVVEKSVGIVDHQLSLHKVRVTTDFAEGIPPLLGNANQIQQVLMNLTINAQHAMGEDGGTISIKTEVDESTATALITVDDTGPGIPEDVAANIFEPFFTTKEAGQGTGLGLSVSYGIIQEHKGAIHVMQAPGGGARFEIRLPLNVPGNTGSLDKAAMESA
jgi:signal transduction histidine kinase